MKQLKKGQMLRIVKGTTGGSFYGGVKIGDIVFFERETNGSYYVRKTRSSSATGFLYATEFEVVCDTVEELKSELRRLDASIDDLKERKIVIQVKIDFMIKHKIEKYDEMEHRAFEVLKILEIDDIAKARKIAKIFQ
jgi:hypothetical protein